MLTFYNEHHAQQAPCSGPWDEHPDALALTLAEFERRGLGRIVTPQGVPLVSLERVHTPRYLHFLRSAWSAWTALDPANAQRNLLPTLWPAHGVPSAPEPDDFFARLGLFASDSGTPIGAGTWLAARTGADCAINAAHALRVGERASFALTRPGQHARAEGFGGGCFLNTAALAAQHLLDDGLGRVAILDIARHHGGGAQDIFYARSDVLAVSLHLDPRQAYPFYSGHAGEQGAGAGLGYTMNLPLGRDCGSAQWLAALETACVKLAMFRPEALVVPLGGLAQCFGLQGGDLLRIGERIAHLDLPTVFMFEGGHGAVHILEGFETAA
ncbi:histone deacetylase family protein [Massilia sp. IC2-477]|uniref:histone deacetylase family protein n=1 Tax=Massilia sp. IC2-477 TaxID=2887198 RepID=UPI001D108C85|nr:histone deacetylase family protein [Massilia sp. IC2-477]MCC2955005.1 histone deacetylase family protein [Massilia sp. IC2-477]